MKLCTLLGSLLLLPASLFAQTTYFSQDFSSSSIVSDYTNNGPNRFTSIFAGSSPPNVSTAAIESGALAFNKAGGAGTGCRFTKIDDLFVTAPEVLYVQFTLTNSITEETTNPNPFNYFYLGDAVANNGAIPSGVNTFASLGFDFKLSSEFRIRTPNGGTTLTKGPFSGTQVVTWILNTTTGSTSYNDGEGHTGTLAGGRMDVWIGGTLEFDDAAVTTTSVVPKTFKFLFSNGNGKITFDNLKILGGASPLPVELTYFRASAMTTGRVQLNWATASEHNSDYFLLERSQDLNQFARVGRLNAAGESRQPRTYSHLDETLPAGTYYYRLVQIDRDESQRRYRPVAVKVGEETPSFQVFPNPSSGGVILVKGNLNPADLVELRTIAGRPISFTRNYDDGPMLIPDKPLAAGLYLVRIRTVGGATSQHKLLVE